MKAEKSKIKLNRQTINIKVSDGMGTEKTVPVIAWIYGQTLAFYKDVTGAWVLTHIPTGLKLGTYKGKYSKIRTLVAILDRFKVNWLINNPYTLLNLLDRDAPYDYYTLMKTILSDDNIDLDIVCELMTKHNSLESIIKELK